MLLLLRFFTFVLRFFKIQKVVTFYVFCRISYVFSNYGWDDNVSLGRRIRDGRVGPQKIHCSQSSRRSFDLFPANGTFVFSRLVLNAATSGWLRILGSRKYCKVTTHSTDSATYPGHKPGRLNCHVCNVSDAAHVS